MQVKKKGSKVSSDDDQSRYERTPEGWADLWKKEFDASDKELTEWRKRAKETLARYLDDRKETANREKRTNLFPVNVINQEALLYGRTPQTDVTRKYSDANDDEARVAGIILERMLNGSLGTPGDMTARSCGYALADFLRVDFGIVKCRYEFETEHVEKVDAVLGPEGEEQAPEVPAHDEKSYENVEVDWYNWQDVKWSPCRVAEQMRWMAFMTPMSRRSAVKRFGALAKNAPLNSKGYDRDSREYAEQQPQHPWDRMNVWEVWSKEYSKVFWYVEGYNKILDEQNDPYELEDFWPFPRPMVSWATTSRFVPKPEYMLAQDSYQAIERLTTRIDLLMESLRVVGMYDENVQEMQTLLEETDENTMIPVSNWAMFAEKGGVEGCVSWFPIEQIVKALTELREQRETEKQLNYEITGFSDIMRGNGDSDETATMSKIKVKSTSIRIQRKQDIFAEFVSEVMRIKAELIAKFYDDDAIRKQSNIDRTPDGEYVEAALKLIREDIHSYRVVVKSEAISLPDFMQMKAERSEAIQGATQFLGGLAALPPSAIPAVPELMEILRWYFAGFRGAASVEGAMDRLINKIQQATDNPQPGGPQGPDPKVQAQQLKNQGDQQRIQAEGQLRMQEIQAETQADLVKQQDQAKYNIQEKQAEHQMEMERAELEASHHERIEREKIQAGQQSEQFKADSAARNDALSTQHAMAQESQAAAHAAAADNRALAHGGALAEQKQQHAVQLGAQKHQSAVQLGAQKQEHGLASQKQKAKDALAIGKLKASGKPKPKKKV